MQRITVKCGNKSAHRRAGYGVFQPGDLPTADASLAAFQLDEANIENIGVLSPEPERNCVNDAGPRRAGVTLEERHAPTVLVTIIPEGFLARCFRSLRACQISLRRRDPRSRRC